METVKRIETKSNNLKGSLIELLIFLMAEGHAKSLQGAMRLCELKK